MAEGLPAAAVWVWVAAAVINIGVRVFWIPVYGGRGAAAASLIAYTVVLILHAILLLRVQRSVK
jgi:Na+-driven multidrug efflux pump